MAKQEVIFIPPCMCGCEIKIHADWGDTSTDAQGRMVSYKHPVPFTVDKCEVVNVCVDHQHYLTDPIAEDPYKGATGYLKIKPDMSPAEKLYIGLYKYSAVSHSFNTCKCRAWVWFDRFETDPTVHYTTAHPNGRGRKCEIHASDPDDIPSPRAEMKTNSDAIKIVRETFGEETEVLTTFNQDREVVVSLPRKTAEEKESIRQLYLSNNMKAKVE